MTLVDILKSYWIDAELKQVEFLQETKALSILFGTDQSLIDPTEAEEQIISLQPVVETVYFYPYQTGDLMMLLKYYFRNHPDYYDILTQAQRVDNNFILGPHQNSDDLLQQLPDLQHFLAVNGFSDTVTIEVLNWQEIEDEIARERRQHVETAVVSNGNTQPKAAEEVKVNRYAYKPELVRINDILSSDGYQRVVIEGELVTMESRRLNSGRYILDTSFYDGTGTIGVKNMYSAQEFEKMTEFLQLNNYYSVTGTVQYDNFSKELLIRATRFKQAKPTPKRQDRSAQKRIELNTQTTMSEIDGIVEVDAYLKQAHAWNHTAIAVTDLNSVQAFPKAFETSKKLGIKVLYGLVLKVYDDTPELAEQRVAEPFDGEFVALDLETTGFIPSENELIEIGAVRIRNGEIVETFQRLIKPSKPIRENITQLTGLTNDDVAQAPDASQVLPELHAFIGRAPIVAHNVDFDVPFLKYHLSMLNLDLPNPTIDTLSLSHLLITGIKRFRLNQVAKYLKISQEQHHRALDDAFVCGKIFIEFTRILSSRGITGFEQIGQLVDQDFLKRSRRKRPVSLLAKNQAGIFDLYSLLSSASIEFLDGNRPCLPWSHLEKHRQNILVGSNGGDGEIFDALFSGLEDDRLDAIAKRYDYLEILPVGLHQDLIRRQFVDGEDTIRNMNQRIVELGHKLNILTVASGHARYLEPEDHIYRNIVRRGQKKGLSQEYGGMYLRTTDEMLQEYAYFGEATAKQLVITNPQRIDQMIGQLEPYPNGKFAPRIAGADDTLREMCLTEAIKRYGDPLPQLIQERLDFELRSIIDNGYAVLYVIAEKLVHKSMESGYLVGSRGSVGSSFAATMCGITEVNPLPPHYYCSDCGIVEFNDTTEFDNGFDMPDKPCPVCNNTFKKDGFNIPFEVFMGFSGNKEPDIDLNFSPTVQSDIHKYVEELLGTGQVFKAGTIAKVAERTAFGYISHYFEEEEQVVSPREINRIVSRITGIRRSSGQHPGGVVVVPKGHHICEFTPIQYPANDRSSGVITTHFDYHAALEGRLFKLDILGHDVPSVIHDLQAMTGVDATSLRFDDPKVISLFNSTEGLGLKDKRYDLGKGTIGIPEFGTPFVRGMLEDTKPQTLEDLIRISGLSHGTNVWASNAQELIRQGTHTIKDVIATREQIMLYGINKGLERSFAFNIMEKVRKGRKLTDQEIDQMRAGGIEDWYIDSCQKISYMFPKAHAVAYVLMSFRIAYFKVYHPLEFYASYFSTRVADFEAQTMTKGIDTVYREMKQLQERDDLTAREQDQFFLYEAVYEMYARGLEFHPVSLMESEASRFTVKDGKILPPLQSASGIAEAAANGIVRARQGDTFLSIEDLANKAGLNKNAIEALTDLGCLDGLSQSNQLDIFSLF